MTERPTQLPDEIVIRRLLETALVSVIDRDATILFESPSIAESLGYRYGELLGKSGFVLLQPEERATIQTFIDAGLRDKTARREIRYRHKDGHTLWMDTVIVALGDGRLLVYRRDVTLRREAERALERANRVLGAIAEVQALFIERSPEECFEKLVEHVAACAEVDGASLFAESNALLAGDDHEGELTMRLRGADGSLVGTIGLRSARGFGSEGLEAVEPLLATAARLLDSLRERRRREAAEAEARLLKTLVHAIEEARDLSSALAIVLRTIVQHTGWEIGQAWTRRLETETLECSRAWFTTDVDRFSGFHDASCSMLMRTDIGILGRVWSTRSRAWVDEDEASRKSYPRVEAARSVGLISSFAVPVLTEGKVVAILEFFSTVRRAEDARLLDTVATAAAQIGASLEKKRVQGSYDVLAVAVATLPDAVFITTARDRVGGWSVVYANAAFAALTGHEDFVGHSPEELNGPATDMSRVIAMREPLLAGKNARGEFVIYHADGTPIEVELTFAPVFEGPPPHRYAIVFVRDLRPTRREEAERAKLRSAVEQAEANAAVGRIVSRVAHEVRNLVFGVGATLDAFDANIGENPEHEKYTTVVRSEIRRLAQLMRDMVEYGTPPRLKPSPCPIEAVITDALASCSARALEAGVSLARAGEKAVPPVNVDRGRIAQVFVELIENAIHHSPPESTVVVRLSRGQRSIDVAFEDRGDWLPLEGIDRVFEPFDTKRAGGTGLGLSIARRIVEQHGGTLIASRNPEGAGSVMTLTLPLPHPPL